MRHLEIWNDFNKKGEQLGKLIFLSCGTAGKMKMLRLRDGVVRVERVSYWHVNTYAKRIKIKAAEKFNLMNELVEELKKSQKNEIDVDEVQSFIRECELYLTANLDFSKCYNVSIDTAIAFSDYACHGIWEN